MLTIVNREFAERFIYLGANIKWLFLDQREN